MDKLVQLLVLFGVAVLVYLNLQRIWPTILRHRKQGPSQVTRTPSTIESPDPTTPSPTLQLIQEIMARRGFDQEEQTDTLMVVAFCLNGLAEDYEEEIQEALARPQIRAAFKEFLERCPTVNPNTIRVDWSRIEQC